MKKKTPLMQQYDGIKAKYPNALLLFRVGDFYETFGEDAVKTAKILDIVLTKRGNGINTGDLALAGFPYHALDTYLPKLIRAGLRVAICDQLEEPKAGKGIVKRGVTELVTPGLSLDENVLDSKSNNYLCAICEFDKIWGIAFLDLSTGEFLCSQGNQAYIQNLIITFNPTELLFSKEDTNEITNWIQKKYNYNTLDGWIFQYEYAVERLKNFFHINSLKGFGLDNMSCAIVASGAIIRYLEETEHHNVPHILSLSRIDQTDYVWLDRFTVNNLELIHPQKEGGVTLVDILDKTVSPMGARLLKQWIIMPLKDCTKIKKRQDVVYQFYQDSHILEELTTLLKACGDLARLISKLATQRINPRETVQLKRSLSQINPIKAVLTTQNETLRLLADQLNTCELLVQKIETHLLEDAGIHSHQGNIIKEGVDDTLDELKKIAFSGKEYLLEIQKREVEETGISSLKISYNRVFGYYLEVTNTHKDKVPSHWIKKQTLSNAERYITPELKEYEEKIINAEEQLVVIEQRLFVELITSSMDYIEPIQKNAHILAEVDCLMSFASIARSNDYCRPDVTEDKIISIKEGRHPVIEQSLPPGEDYIPNNILLDNDQQQIMIITGPNMAGKSAFLRQTALILLMAQIGSFVPAKKASIGYVDKIFTRVGASDNISQGESTFMVEMTETASILNNLSERSLVIMDEIGRGTSTYDGISIAWSIVEYLHNHSQLRPKTLFATHYHELNQLTKEHDRIKNFNVAVKEIDGKIIFLRKVRKGGSEHSYGIHVAQLAGIPNKVLIRAQDIMQQLEKDQLRSKNKKTLNNLSQNQFQLNLFDEDPRLKAIKTFIETLDINTLSPVEALLKLNEIKQKMNS